MKDYNIQTDNKNKSQQEIENNKSKRQVKNVLKKYTCEEDYDDEHMYSNFEKFQNKPR